jgi:hypothetical protein
VSEITWMKVLDKDIYMLKGNIMNIKDTYGYIEGEGQMFFKIVK